mgnify:CR=1 FL=1
MLSWTDTTKQELILYLHRLFCFLQLENEGFLGIVLFEQKGGQFLIFFWIFVKETSNTTEQELRREVEDLKLRLQMAADHYKEKFKECQKLQKQVNKFTEQAVSEWRNCTCFF